MGTVAPLAAERGAFVAVVRDALLTFPPHTEGTGMGGNQDGREDLTRRRRPLPCVLFGGNVGGVYPLPCREVLTRKAAKAFPGRFLSEGGTLAPVYCRNLVISIARWKKGVKHVLSTSPHAVKKRG